ncbi:MAG: ribonuclease HII [bacterium]
MIEMKNIYKFENEQINKGVKYIAGVDEAGRGPLAGALVVAACILPNGVKIEGVDDSKSISDKKRRIAFEEIKKHAIAYSIVFITPEEIDEHNIYAATQLGMMRAIDELSIKPEHVLIDAMPLPNLTIEHQSIIKGDALSVSIGAASILAKVTRDDYMESMHLKYPEYSFNKHKGYGTKVHMEALEKYGPCDIHRKSYKPIKKFLEDPQMKLDI